MSSKRVVPEELKKLLSRSRVSETMAATSTHYGLGMYVGKYKIRKADKRMFYDLVFNAITKLGAIVSLVEVHKEFGPVVVDIDLKYKSDGEERRYTPEMVRSLIALYVELIGEYFNATPEQLECVVMEKSAPSFSPTEKMCKDGFHLMFPKLCVRNDIQLLIRKKVVRRLEEENIFHEVRTENTIEDIVDKQVIQSAGWMVYGCQKPEGKRYVITTIYDSNLEEMSKEAYVQRVKEKMGVNIIQFLSIRKFSDADVMPLKHGVTMHHVETELFAYGVLQKEKEEKKDYRAENEDKEKSRVIEKEFTVSDKVRHEKQNIETARKLVRMLSTKRAYDYNDWIQLGMCLHSISDTLVDVWDEFSRLVPEKYKEGECHKLWGGFKRNELKMGTLFYWAKNDSPIEFKKFKEDQNQNIIERIIFQPSQTRMAKLIYNLYKDYIVTTPTSNDRWVWYKFDGLYWKNLGTMASKFKLKIEHDLYALFENELRKYQNLASNAREKLRDMKMNGDDDAASEKIDEEMKLTSQVQKYERFCTNITKNILPKLESPTYLRAVIQHSGYHFHDEEFLNKLDKKLHLICFRNGVYDLKEDKFREGLFEDFISMRCGVEYHPRPEIEHYYDAVLSLLRANHPDDEDFEYLMLLYASCLQGNREDESFHILKGKGANGKTIETTLLKEAFGDYFANITPALLTQKRASSSAPQADIVRLKGKRLVVAEEPDKGEVLNAGMVKELTGGGVLSARTLYSSEIETFDCNFVLMLCTNTYPAVHTTDGGTWRRIKVIEYPCKYVLNEKDLQKNNPLVKRGDPHLKTKVRTAEYGMGLMSLLIDYYRVFKKKGLYPPPNVRAASEGYQKMSNMYLTFTRDMLEQTNNENDKIHMKDMYRVFKDWVLDASGKKVSVNRNEFIDCMRTEIGFPEGTDVVTGYRFKGEVLEEKSLY